MRSFQFSPRNYFNDLKDFIIITMASEQTNKNPPVCLIVLGMAGSGKTSLVTRLTNSPKKPYVLNLDPACINLPYFANIGIN